MNNSQESFNIGFNSWIKYANSAGDFNLIHRVDKIAKEFGLEERICPGMYIASLAQCHLKENINSLKIKFRGIVKENEIITLEKNEKGIFFKKDGEDICEIIYGNENNQKILNIKTPNYTKEFDICPKKIGGFLESIYINQMPKILPQFYLAALAAGTLVDYGREKKKSGMHTFQSVNFYEDYNYGKINILIEETNDKTNFVRFNVNFVQEGRLIASGKSTITRL